MRARRTRRAGRGLLLAVAGAVALAVVAFPSAAGLTPTLTTDKADYAPGAVVHLSGTAFAAATTYALPVQRPDGTVVLVDPLTHVATPGWTTATSDAAGNLAVDYQLDGIAGSYEARAYPAGWAGDWSQTPLASVTFTDSSANLDQCENGAVGAAPEPCRGSNALAVDGFKSWGGGNSNSAKSHWAEDEFIPYRAVISGVGPGTHTLSITYDTVHGGVHALDYLGSFDATETTSAVANALHANNNNPCADVLTGVLSAQCTPASPAGSFAFPPPTFTSCGGSGGTAPTPISGADASGRRMKIWGPGGTTVTNVTPFDENTPSGVGQCSTTLVVSFSVGGAAASNTVVLAWSGHIARGPGFNGWGAGQGASDVQGSPYHMAFDTDSGNPDRGLDGASQGGQDHQLAASAVIPASTITIVKTAVGGNDTFAYTTTGGGGLPAGFSITTSGGTGQQVNPGVNPGTYTVTESTPPSGWNFSNLVCSATGTGSSATPNGATANITIGVTGGASITCTYTNTRKANPTVTTAILVGNGTTDVQNTTIALGSSIHDTVTVSGSAGTPTGTADFTFFGNGTCDAAGVIATESNAPLSGGSAASAARGPLTPGTYSYLAHYDGDTNYFPGDAACEKVTVGKGTPAVATVVKDAGGTTVDNTNPAALGSQVHDTATLSGGTTGFSLDSGATVTYRFYTVNDCSTLPAPAGETVTVAANETVPNSSATGALGAGSYSYQATYNGNSNYNAVTGPCEPFKAAKATPGIATVVKDAGGTTVDNSNPAVLGTQVHDTATLSGGTTGFSLDTGATVTYRLYTVNDCSTLPAPAGETVTVAANETVPNSSATGALGAGSYSYQATYNGNSNYNTATGPCEPFKIAKATPGIATVVKDAGGTTVDNNSPAALGSQVHDTATLSGGTTGFSLDTGATVTYRLYTVNDCSTQPAPAGETVTVAANETVPNSAATAALGAGSYSYQATYNGNSNYATATGPCEPFKIAKATPGIATVVKDAGGTTVDNNSPAALGSQLHDTATLSGGTSGFSLDTGATVTYRLYTTSDCSGTAATSEDVTVAANETVPNSAATAALGAGSYSYRATYNGNANYNTATGACEPFQIAKATPAIATVVKDAVGTTVDNNNPAALGSQVHDTATLSGGTTGFSLDTGATVTYRLYTTSDCSGTAATSEDVTVAANETVPNSAATAALAAGSYSYQATYNGNANYNTATGLCEPFKVARRTPAIATVVKDAGGTTVDNTNPAALGSQVHDTATLSGGTSGFSLDTGATVTYRLYTTTDCSGAAATSEDKTVAANETVPNSAASAALATGSYSYQATYNGNSNYNATTGPCEPFKVAKRTPGIVTVVKDAGGATVDNLNFVFAGAQVHDTATLSGGAGGFSLDSGATVTYRFYATNDCSGSAAASESKTVAANETVPDSSTSAPLAFGLYSYRATYNGNANYETATGDCEPFQVLVTNPLVTTAIYLGGGTTDVQNTVIPLGSTIHDTVTVAGFVPSRTVDFAFFANGTCGPAGEITPADSDVPLVGAKADSTARGPLAAGTYSFLAHYDGDANNASVNAPCETVTVGKATPSISTIVRNAAGTLVDNGNPAALGTQVHDTATLGSGVPGFSLNSGAKVTYSFFASNDCSTGPTTEDVVVGAAGSVPDSSATAALAAGAYSYRARYGGNDNYNAATGACEPFKVAKANPTIATVVKSSTGSIVDNVTASPAGSQVHDTATLTGVPGFSLNTSATVTYRLYATNDCSGAATTSEAVAVTAGETVPDSSPTAALVAGSYSYRATYNGNANYNAATGPCEPFKVIPVSFGKLEICKSSANGMSGVTFQFTLNGGTPVSVRGGRCTGPMTVIAGTVTIVELPSSPPTDLAGVSARPSARLLSLDLTNRTTVVSVVAGSTATNETMVTFTNAPAGGTTGDLKVCKLSSSPAYWGRLFSFSVNGGPLASTGANPALDDPATWSCRILGTYKSGSIVTVHEAVPAGAEVDFIDTTPAANLVDFNTDTGTAQVRVTGPVTTVLFDDEPIPPPQAGYIEVCKDAFNGDPFVTGPYTFTITPPDGNSFDVSTVAGQCTASFKVAAGVVRVTERALPNQTLVDAYAVPSSRFDDVNLTNGMLDVEVPVGDPSSETQVHFVNQRDRAQLQVCKALGPSSSALEGQAFTFTVTSAGMPTATPTVMAAAATQCVVAGSYPVGNTVTVAENLAHGSGQPGEFIDTTGEGTFTIAPGANQVTITNTARGLLEVCKTRIDYLTGTQPTFRFRIDGGALFTVQAGKCSPGIRVPPGQHTVTETAENDYELADIGATPPDRLTLEDVPGRTATLSVPFAGNGNGDTAVTFTNQVRRGQIKVCKQVPLGSIDPLYDKLFSWDVYVQNDDGTTPSPFTVGPISARNGCTGFTGYYPILNRNGSKKAVGVHEQGVPSLTWSVTAITTVGTRGLCFVTDLAVNTAICPYPAGSNPNLPNGNIDFYLGPNADTVTYTNQAK